MATTIRHVPAEDGARIAYWTQGSGPPLLYVPVPCCSHAQHDLEVAPLASWYERLSSRLQLVRLDFRGYGASQRDGVALSIDAFRGDILAVADALRLSRFSLFAQGGAAPAAISLAASNDRIEKLILFDGWANGPTLPVHEAVTAAQGVAEFDYRMFSVMVARLVFNAPEEMARPLARLIRLSADAEQWGAFSELFSKTDVTDSLADVRCPTMIVHSGPGTLTGHGEESLALSGAIPGAELASFSAPHFPLAETDEIFDAMMEFLAAGPERDVEGLSPREREVLDLLATGRTNQQIAAELVISTPTVARHVHNLLTKLQLSNRTEAAGWAAAHQHKT